MIILKINNSNQSRIKASSKENLVESHDFLAAKLRGYMSPSGGLLAFCFFPPFFHEYANYWLGLILACL